MTTLGFSLNPLESPEKETNLGFTEQHTQKRLEGKQHLMMTEAL